MQHIAVYRAAGRYAGWPANYGIWHWEHEIVAGFTLGTLHVDGGFHPRDKTQPFLPMQARSLDGGETWRVAPLPARTPGGRGLSADEHVEPDLQVAPLLDGPEGPGACPGDVDFTQPDFALLCARSGLRSGARSWFYLSTDRAQHWQGPYALPDFGRPGIAARTDYLVTGPRSASLFLTAAKANGDEGRVFCAQTEDGGRTFAWRAWVGPEPAGYAIMPASVALPSGRWLCALRLSAPRATPQRPPCWIDLYASDDAGASWRYLARPVDDTGMGGNPPTLTRLHDGRLCLTYGYRNPPYALRAVFSADDGRTWGAPLTLRAGAGNHDLGYPRTVQRPDGGLVTVYYWNDHAQGERYIAATLWQPPG